MFSSTILDAAAGVIFAFLAVSLFTSSAVEAVNSVLKLRSRFLVGGIKTLVNDPGFSGLARSLYAHAAVNPRGPGAANPLERAPAYIEARQFAGALMDITGLSAATTVAAAQAPGPAAVAALKTQLTLTDPQLRQFVEGLVDRSNGDLDQLQASLAAWFDTGMDRVSGAFKRWTQLASFVIALLIAILVNVDAIRLATLLWEQPMLADQLRPPASLSGALAGDVKAREDAADEILTMLQGSLPVGWAPGRFMQVRDGQKGWKSLFAFPDLLWAFFGWTVTAIAALFGAPFWFDILQSVIRLKGAGPSPAEKITGRAAAN